MDLISRQAAINSMCELMRHWFGCDPKDEIREIKRELGKLPSAQPQRMRGRWEDAHRSRWDGTFYWFIKCNNCEYERKDDNHDLDAEYKFCPNCGADMREGEQDDG